ncbi:MAG: hypothetical protein N4Q32_03115, partial [Neisseriaceae bacterium]|nr:hypothetical protein [Neisseriaceae bacterium]
MTIGQTVIGHICLDVENKLFLDDYPEYPVEIATSYLILPDEGDKVSAIFDGQVMFVVFILEKSKKEEVVTLDFKKNNLKIVAPNIEMSIG